MEANNDEEIEPGGLVYCYRGDARFVIYHDVVYAMFREQNRWHKIPYLPIPQNDMIAVSGQLKWNILHELHRDGFELIKLQLGGRKKRY